MSQGRCSCSRPGRVAPSCRPRARRSAALSGGKSPRSGGFALLVHQRLAHQRGRIDEVQERPATQRQKKNNGVQHPGRPAPRPAAVERCGRLRHLGGVLLRASPFEVAALPRHGAAKRALRLIFHGSQAVQRRHRDRRGTQQAEIHAPAPCRPPPWRRWLAGAGAGRLGHGSGATARCHVMRQRHHGNRHVLEVKERQRLVPQDPK
jgi:hypothetical protein